MNRKISQIVFLLNLICINFLHAQTAFVLRQDAKKISKSCFTITLDQLERKGAIWWPNKVDLSKDLELNFIVFLGARDGGADGIAFVFHNDPRDSSAVGSPAGGLNFGDHPDRGTTAKITPSVAIEMDTYANPQCGPPDPYYDHTAIVYNGDMCNPKLISKKLHLTKDNVEDNTCYKAKITWTASTKTLKLYFTNKDQATQDLIFTYSDDLVNNVFGGVKNVYYGFTGSTGGAGNDQTICIFEGNSFPTAKNDYATTPYGLPVDVNVQANDFDSDGDPIYTTAIINPPKHGTASILSYKNKIRYSPNAGYAGLDSLEYRVCDLDPGTGAEKCYANCSNAWVILNKVECPTYTLMAAKTRDNVKCVEAKPDNGAARAYMWDGTKEITTDFTFKWYKGNYTLPAQVAGLTPYYTGVTISNLADGTYTVWAELNQNTTCKAINVASITINRDNTQKPLISVIKNKDVTNCNPANGELQVVFTDPAANPSDYSIIWYEVFPTMVFTGQIFNKAEVKTYSVEVTNLASGCSSTGTGNVGKNYTSPTVTRNSTSRKSCSVPDGSLSANVGGNTTNYEFRWSVLNDKKMLNPFIGPVYSGLDTGNYWLNVRDKITGCYYDTISVKVADGRVMPSISISQTPQTSCDPSKPNGTITASVANSVAGVIYTYQWYEGNNTSTAFTSPGTSSGNTASKLKAVDYTVVVTNTSTGCTSVKTGISILEDKDTPVIKVLTQISPTKCSPANGQIIVEADPDGAGPKPSPDNTYTFKWWKGASVKITAPDYTGASIMGLAAGQYTVQATSAFGCQTNTTVTLNPVPAATYPTVTLTPTNNSSCDPLKPNGRIIASITGGTGPFTYRWYTGISTSPVDLLSSFNDMLTITDLKVNSYTLLVTDAGTGCTVQKSTDINYTPFLAFTVTADKNSDMSCMNALTGPDGSVYADVGGNITDYNFNWYKGNSVSGVPDYTGNIVNGLPAGDYTVVATHKTNYCVSPSSTVTILDDPKTTIVIVINTPSAGCITSSGTLKASAGPGTSYTFDWFQGVPDLPIFPYFSYGKHASNTDQISGLAPSKYTVRVTDNVTNCVVLKTMDLSSSLPIPEVYLKPTVNNTSCSSANGVLEIDYIVPDPINAPAVHVTPDGTGNFPPGYEIYWINGPNRPATLTGATTSNKYLNLAAGQYVVVVKVPPNPCESIPVSATIIDDPNRTPIVTISKVDQTHCAPLNGSIKVTITNYTGIAANYSQVVKRNGATIPNVSLPVFTNPWDLTGLENGVYTITITNTTNSCPVTKIVTISDQHTSPIKHLSISKENTSCSPTANGEINIIGANLAAQKYNWYRSNNTPLGDLAGNDPSITGLSAGGYYVIITDRTTGCTYTESASIMDAQVYPTISVESTVSRSRCTSPFDGSAIITLGPSANYTDYTLSWTLPYPTAPIPTVGPGSATNKFIASNLDTGNYVLTVTDPLVTCSTSTPFKIGFEQDIPVVDLTANGVTACVPNGSITATITKGATLYNIILTDLKTGTPTAQLGVSANPLLFSPLLPGEYLATVTDSKGCNSTPTQITVPDKVVKPKIQIVNLSHNSSCDITKPNGFISVTSTPYKNYKFNWSVISGSFTTVNDSTIKDVQGGKYRITVKDLTPGSVCKDSMDIVIKDSLINITPLISKFDVTYCTYPYDGALIASVNGGIDDYIFTWKNIDSTKTYIGSGFSNLPPGNYTLDVYQKSTFCSVLNLPVKLDYMPIEPIVTLMEDAPQSNCDPLKPNAQWYASIGGEISGYTFDWYEGNSVASGKLHYSGSTSAKMKAVEYTLRITDLIRGCIKDTVITPSDKPAIVPAPGIDSLRHRTSCISPNGYVEVSVDGNNSGYIFNWYNKENTSGTPIYTGYVQETLDLGDYWVTAKDRLTGCISAPAKIRIIDGRIYPEFESMSKSSLCTQNDGTTHITWVAPVLVNTITMTNGKVSYTEPEAWDMPPGEFEVTLTSPEGCTFTKNITIGVDFMVYNGITPNGDGNNDLLLIECIDYFPKNTVKVYNRSGNLVYEGKGYDNKSVYFDGHGNKGTYLAGSNLPDGTYYYIVDSGTGKKSKVGFFELLR